MGERGRHGLVNATMRDVPDSRGRTHTLGDELDGLFVPAPPAARAAGTGIGLRIVRALAGLHPGLTFTGETAGGKFVAELRWR